MGGQNLLWTFRRRARQPAIMQINVGLQPQSTEYSARWRQPWCAKYLTWEDIGIRFRLSQAGVGVWLHRCAFRHSLFCIMEIKVSGTAAMNEWFS